MIKDDSKMLEELENISANAFVSPAIKITITGNGAVGKTSLCQQLTTGFIPGTYNLTVGCEIHTQKYAINNGEKNLSLVLWDLAGQDRFESIRDGFYSGSHASLVVFDITSRGSFYDCNSWVRELKRNSPNTPFILVGNKSDKAGEDLREVGKDEALDLAKKFGVPYIETSAKKGINVNHVFQMAAKLALSHNNPKRDSRLMAY